MRSLGVGCFHCKSCGWKSPVQHYGDSMMMMACPKCSAPLQFEVASVITRLAKIVFGR